MSKRSTSRSATSRLHPLFVLGRRPLPGPPTLVLQKIFAEIIRIFSGESPPQRAPRPRRSANVLGRARPLPDDGASGGSGVRPRRAAPMLLQHIGDDPLEVAPIEI